MRAIVELSDYAKGLIENSTQLKSCEICYEEFDSNGRERMQLNPCGHVICRTCIWNYYRGCPAPVADTAKCPFCRVQILYLHPINSQKRKRPCGGKKKKRRKLDWQRRPSRKS